MLCEFFNNMNRCLSKVYLPGKYYLCPEMQSVYRNVVLVPWTRGFLSGLNAVVLECSGRLSSVCRASTGEWRGYEQKLGRIGGNTQRGKTLVFNTVTSWRREVSFKERIRTSRMRATGTQTL